LPLIGGLWQVFGFGLALGLAAVNVFYRDVGQALGVLFQVWMWSTPIVYYEHMLPDTYRAFLPMNPAYAFAVPLRDAYLHASGPSIMAWSAMIGWGALTVVLGYCVLSRLRPDIRDVL
jgi:ABC-type polysaccharide/polyol phosphate export permease